MKINIGLLHEGVFYSSPTTEQHVDENATEVRWTKVDLLSGYNWVGMNAFIVEDLVIKATRMVNIKKYDTLYIANLEELAEVTEAAIVNPVKMKSWSSVEPALEYYEQRLIGEARAARKAAWTPEDASGPLVDALGELKDQLELEEETD